jgi:hypothetical protein
MKNLTGTVVDSGDGVTHIIPVVTTFFNIKVGWFRDWKLYKTYPTGWKKYHGLYFLIIA